MAVNRRSFLLGSAAALAVGFPGRLVPIAGAAGRLGAASTPIDTTGADRLVIAIRAHVAGTFYSERVGWNWDPLKDHNS